MGKYSRSVAEKYLLCVQLPVSVAPGRALAARHPQPEVEEAGVGVGGAVHAAGDEQEEEGVLAADALSNTHAAAK